MWKRVKFLTSHPFLSYSARGGGVLRRAGRNRGLWEETPGKDCRWFPEGRKYHTLIYVKLGTLTSALDSSWGWFFISDSNLGWNERKFLPMCKIDPQFSPNNVEEMVVSGTLERRREWQLRWWPLPLLHLRPRRQWLQKRSVRRALPLALSHNLERAVLLISGWQNVKDTKWTPDRDEVF